MGVFDSKTVASIDICILQCGEKKKLDPHLTMEINSPAGSIKKFLGAPENIHISGSGDLQKKTSLSEELP